MPSFLLNSKMNPALRARILKSLGARTGSARLAPRSVAVLRAAALLGIALAVVLFVVARNEQARELARGKAELHALLERHAAGLSEQDRASLPRAEESLRRLNEAYQGDFVAKEIAGAEAAARMFARPLLYARGQAKAFGQERDVARFIASSSKDSLLACLAEPPPADDEAALLRHLDGMRREAFPKTNSATLLSAGLAALPILEPRWAERIDRAEHVEELLPLRKLLQVAPLEAAAQAAHAELFIAVVDEANDPNAPVEIDGTGRHFVQLHVIDRKLDRELARLRRVVDPEWVSVGKRSRRGGDLVGCKLGFEVRSALAAAQPGG